MIIITVYMGKHGHVEWTSRHHEAKPTEREKWAQDEDVVAFVLQVVANAHDMHMGDGTVSIEQVED